MPYPEEKWTPEQRAKKQAQLAQQTTDLRNAQAPRGLPVPATAQQSTARGLLPDLNIMGPARAAQEKRDNELVQVGSGRPATRGGARPVAAVTQPETEQELGLGDRLRGGLAATHAALSLPNTLARALVAKPADALRNTVIEAAGGDPSTSDGGETANQDQAYAQLQPYIDGARGLYDRAGGAVSGAILDATGAKRVQPQAVQPQVAASQPAASPDGTVASAQSPAAQEAVTAPAQAEGQYGFTGIGKGRQGGEIVGRTGADGVREYTNSPEAVAGASGKFGLGRGTFTQGNPGDAAKATAAFERANDEKRKMVASAQQGELGNNGGRVTVVEDSNVGIGIDRERNKNRVYRNRAEEEKANIAKQVTLDTNSRANADSEARGLKSQQELEAGALALDNNRQLESIKAQLANPNLPDAQRKALQETYYILTTAAKDRYMEVRGGANESGAKDASKVLDVLNGGYVGQQAGGAGAGAQPPENHIAALRKNPAQAAHFDEIYGAGAAARILGVN